MVGRAKWRRPTGFVVAVSLLAVVAASCSSAHTSTTPTTTATPALSKIAARKLASQIISPIPSVRQTAVVPQLASQLGSTPPSVSWHDDDHRSINVQGVDSINRDGASDDDRHGGWQVDALPG